MKPPERRNLRRVRMPRARPRGRAVGDAGSPLEVWAAEHGITPAELRVVHHCVRGLSNKEIAPLVGISAATVRAHLMNIFRKLAISSRGELAHAVFTVIERRTAELLEDRQRLILELETERATLEKERALLGAVLGQSSLGVVVADVATRRILLANEEAVRLLGRQPADIGEYCALLAATTDEGRPLAPGEYPVARALATGEHVAAELQRRAPDGAVQTLEVHASPIRDHSGAMTAVLGVLIDATRRKAAERELVSAERAARDALVAREQFMKVVSHDLSAPVENLLRLGEALAGVVDVPNGDRRVLPGRSLARRIQTVARDLWSYLHDLIELGELDGGRLRVRPATLAPAALVADAAQYFRRDDASPVTLEVRVPETLPFVMADRTRIHRVLVSLLDRARAESPAGGTVVLEAVAVGGAVRFTVRDSGPPLPLGHETKIFDRNWLVRVGARRGYPLALLVAKATVEQHLGRLWAESGPEGTSFHFTLPVT